MAIIRAMRRQNYMFYFYRPNFPRRNLFALLQGKAAQIREVWPHLGVRNSSFGFTETWELKGVICLRQRS